jgi:predicted secreted protein
MDQLKAPVVAVNFQLVVKIPQEECTSNGHGHHQAETGSWKLKTRDASQLVYEDNFYNNGQHGQVGKMHQAIHYH